ncbi:hypothetical protein [Variovorax paradoxus]|uniref:hypothetical protein n=1 Tax=Variovorax paradoxus TaxID=34073 RepID=UPI001931E287|nr:hypothetical protein INQ48_18050 [Variovorax paradoxus]
MTDINDLSSNDQLSIGDLIPIWSSANGDTRRISITALVAFVMAQVAANSGFVTQYAAPSATGFSVQIKPPVAGTAAFLLLTPAAAYAAGTVILPPVAECIDGQEVLVTCTQAVTALTVNGNGATAVNGAPATLAANSFFRLRFDFIAKSWYRVG